MIRSLTPVACTAFAALCVACAGAPNTPKGPTAVARLQPTTGNTANGMVRFVQAGDKVLVAGEIRDLQPNTEHGFHIHEKGDCSSGDAMSAGGHFNPGATQHGQYSMAMHHAGDLPSLKADGNGVGSFSVELEGISVGGTTADILGRGLIVHRDPDDFKTQPTGNSGPRLACAVIVREAM
jgi:Cu-Zn family superoxide dismutase